MKIKIKQETKFFFEMYGKFDADCRLPACRIIYIISIVCIFPKKFSEFYTSKDTPENYPFWCGLCIEYPKLKFVTC